MITVFNSIDRDGISAYLDCLCYNRVGKHTILGVCRILTAHQFIGEKSGSGSGPGLKF